MSKELDALQRMIDYGYVKSTVEELKIIEKALKTLQEHEEILNSYGLNLCDFREACLLLAQWRGSNLSYSKIHKELKKVEKLKKENKTTHEYNVQLCLVRDKLNKALEIMKYGLNLEHILLIQRTKTYEEYDAKFDLYLEKRYEPFKFEIRKSREEYNLLKEVLNG